MTFYLFCCLTCGEFCNNACCWWPCYSCYLQLKIGELKREETQLKAKEKTTHEQIRNQLGNHRDICKLIMEYRDNATNINGENSADHTESERQALIPSSS
jgi:hypothetical protein